MDALLQNIKPVIEWAQGDDGLQQYCASNDRISSSPENG